MSYDLRVYSNISIGSNKPDEMLEKAKKYGFKSLVFQDVNTDNIRETSNQIKQIRRIAYVACNIKVENESLRKIREIKRKVDRVVAEPSSLSECRRVVKIGGVDSILLRIDERPIIFDSVCAKEASRRGKSVEIEISDIFGISGRKRVTAIGTIRLELKIARHYGIPILIGSGAKSIDELKRPLTLKYVAHRILDLPLVAVENSMTSIARYILGDKNKG